MTRGRITDCMPVDSTYIGWASSLAASYWPTGTAPEIAPSTATPRKVPSCSEPVETMSSVPSRRVERARGGREGPPLRSSRANSSPLHSDRPLAAASAVKGTKSGTTSSRTRTATASAAATSCTIDTCIARGERDDWWSTRRTWSCVGDSMATPKAPAPRVRRSDQASSGITSMPTAMTAAPIGSVNRNPVRTERLRAVSCAPAGRST